MDLYLVLLTFQGVYLLIVQPVQDWE
eukprot:COSAG05_NODE_6492_length_947_cov_1.261792_1_plen_25_part_10